MSYNTFEFIGFLAVFLMIYCLMPNVRMRQIMILIGNLFFYSFAGKKCLLIVLFTSVVVYLVSRMMERVYAGYELEKAGLTPKEQMALFATYKKRCRKYLIFGIIVILGILVCVKVGKLFEVKTILVPLGISYYTFSSIGYLLDIYWNKIKCEHNYLKLLMCITYFPTIVQGPISRYNKLMKQFDELPGFDFKRICFGLQLMVWGYFKKFVVADRLSMYTSSIFENLQAHAGVEIVLAVILCAIELYADFSGCMDIVRGAAQAMGVTLDLNFNQPFFSKSAAEFWRRWHITLGAWFKDYIYMPIAMNPHFMRRSMKVRQKYGARVGQLFSTAIPLIIVWLFTGLWHGTGMDYVVWGIYWGVLIILGSFLTPEFKKITSFLKIDTSSFGYRFFQMARTFCLFCIGRMLTVTGSLHGFVIMVKQIFASPKWWVLFNEGIFNYGMDQKEFHVAIVGIIIMWIVDMMHEKIKIRETLSEQPLVFRWMIYFTAIALIIVYGVYGAEFDASSFVYGAF